MKKLQNNFTTLMQSMQLLALGVPADSADCFRNGDKCIRVFAAGDKMSNVPEWIGCTPCWSVGRLIEIFAICFDPDFIHFDTYADGINFLQQMVDKFETYAENMDFSKLEE